MPVDVEEEAWQAITAIEAQDLLELARVAQVPHMKPDVYKQYYKQLDKAGHSFRKTKDNSTEVSTKDLAEMLKAKLGRQ